MVEVKFVTSKELVKQMAQQPLALRKRLQKLWSTESQETETLLTG